MEKVKQMEAESAQARSKSDYAGRPASYKTSLSTQLSKGKQRSPSPGKKIVVVKQGGRRRDEEDERDSGPSKPQPSAEVTKIFIIVFLLFYRLWKS